MSLSKLYSAINNGKTEEATGLLQNDDVKKVINQYITNYTCLHCACIKGQTAICRQLLDLGAGVELKDKKFGATALGHAALFGHKDCAELLLNKGASFQVQDNNRRTPLHNAATQGHDQCVLLLLDRGANVNAQGYNGATPLHGAAENGHFSTVKALLNRGVNIQMQDDIGKTSLHYAANAAQYQCLELLLQKGASVQVQDKDGTTVLHNTATRGHSQCMELLLRHGASVDVQERRFGMTALHCAAGAGHLQCIELLLNAGAGLHTVDNVGRTPLHYAAFHGKLSCVKLLVDKGADVFAKVTKFEGHLNNKTAEQLAVEKNHSDVVAFLRDTAEKRMEESRVKTEAVNGKSMKKKPVENEQKQRSKLCHIS